MKTRAVLLAIGVGALCGGGGVAGGYLLGHHQLPSQVTLTPQALRQIAKAESGAIDAGITNYINERCTGSNFVRDALCPGGLGGGG